MAIKFAKAAEDDLLGIFLYGIEEHGIAQAARCKAKLNQSFQIISDTPKIARLRREIKPPVRVYAAQKHMIVYTIANDEETALILRVRHQRENWTENPIVQVQTRAAEMVRDSSPFLQNRNCGKPLPLSAPIGLRLDSSDAECFPKLIQFRFPIRIIVDRSIDDAFRQLSGNCIHDCAYVRRADFGEALINPANGMRRRDHIVQLQDRLVCS